MNAPLSALSPLDGRYAKAADELRDWFSERALIRHRLQVEVLWLIFLAEHENITELSLSAEQKAQLHRLYRDFTPLHAEQIKAIESELRHDVKAVEQFLCRELRLIVGNTADHSTAAENFVHFGCTSEDINNLAWATMIRGARDRVMLPHCDRMLGQLQALAEQTAELPMPTRTHGQAASPTTLGKEIAVFGSRLRRLRDELAQRPIRGKFNGAVGNFNAHLVAYPELDWIDISQRFVRDSLQLEWTALSTQIESHDWLAAMLDTQALLNTVLLDLCRDLWGYISLDYFHQTAVAGEVGSSTMPHKINPIDFENAEGNLGIANSLLRHLSGKLPISRFQRDLSDSTAMRNIGVAFGHSLIACNSLCRGLERISPKPATMRNELQNSWEVLAEAIQTVLRRYGAEAPYDALKAMTRGHAVDREALAVCIADLDIPEAVRQQLLALEPATYIGLAAQLARLDTDRR